MIQITVSVIILIYNGFTRLDKTVLNATVTKEIILINDGSTDDSAEICQQYADIFPEYDFFMSE